MKFERIIVIVVVQILTSATAIQKPFRRYKLQPNGCDSYKETARLRCAFSCSSSSDCAAYSYDALSQMCEICSQRNVTTVGTNKEMFWQRHVMLFNVVKSSVKVPGNGNLLIKLQGILPQATSNSWLMIEYISPQVEFTRPFKLSFDSPNVVYASSKVNFTWDYKLCCTSPEAFSAGLQLDIAVVNTYQLFYVYINSEYCCNYSHRAPYDVASTFHVFNNFRVIEFSS